MRMHLYIQKGQVFFKFFFFFVSHVNRWRCYIYLYILVLYNTHTECVQELLYCVNKTKNLADVVRVFSTNLNQMSQKYIILGGRELGQPKICLTRRLVRTWIKCV